MNLKDMEYFQCLCRYKNFTKAAEKMYVSQPSITMAVKKLEKEMGAELIIRNTSEKTISLTKEGEIVLKHAENILNEIENMKTEINKNAGRKVKLGLPPIIGAYFFPMIMELLVKEGLAQSIELVETGSLEMKKLLENGEVDIALIASLNKEEFPGFDAKLLAEDEFKVCLSSSNELAEKEAIDISDLKGQQFVVLGDNYIHNEVFENICEKGGLNDINVCRSDEIQTVKSLIASGFGIGIMVNMAVKDMQSIVTRELKDKIFFNIYIMKRADRNYSVKEEEIYNKIISFKY